MTDLAATPGRSALADCGQLDGMRTLSRLVGGVLLLLIIASFVTPWTQIAPGDGRVIAHSPAERETPVRAPMDGRIVRWLVTEGTHVERGQAIAELEDNDPQILERLAGARDAAQSQGRAIESAVARANSEVEALSDSRDAALDRARTQITIARDIRDAAKQKLLAARAQETTAMINLERQGDLNQKDLSSDRELELAELSAATAESEVRQAQSSLRAAEGEVRAVEASLAQIRESNRANIERTQGEIQKLRASASEVTGKTAEAETRLSRQEQMAIVAPRAGQIMSIIAREGSDFVKAGEKLATLIPHTEDRAVEIWVDGNDVPLITDGRHVRLQFEGWPAVQFVGWPSVAVGTFGGRVEFVDPASREDGQFRVMVVPDPEDEAWPEAKYLRQGVRARGWILLNRVSVAYELWRQLNGFPPVVSEGAQGSPKASAR